ncbi:helix-turn-helix domain-containing protein [Rosenbergiella gaditana]|uniref:helix-turn-helix domain-containing protein n=1 Tax=Rosenbergiella gaditana TaxID=2726987 RepID=UPI002024E60A|nr:helix-turn-helix domain-containing protein [Rosenbergiella gaditana]
MSMILMATAMKIKVGNPLRKLVLIKLADNANDDGICWPSISNIADHCEISPRSVQNHISALKEMRLLTVINRKTETGLNQSNVFKISLNQTGAYAAGSGAGDSKTGAGDAGGGAYAAGGGAGDAPVVVQELHPEPITLLTYQEPVSETLGKTDPATQNYLKRMGMTSPSETQIPFPKNFKPNDEHKSIALERGINLQEELIKCRDHSEASGIKKQSWSKYFNNWLRNARPSQVKPTHQSAIQVTKSGYVFIN